MFKIDSDVPYEGTGSNRRSKIEDMPFKDLKPGQSFFIPGGTNEDGKSTINTKINWVAKARKLYPSKTFVSKTVTENGELGLRVWRIEDGEESSSEASVHHDEEDDFIEKEDEEHQAPMRAAASKSTKSKATATKKGSAAKA